MQNRKKLPYLYPLHINMIAQDGQIKRRKTEDDISYEPPVSLKKLCENVVSVRRSARQRSEYQKKYTLSVHENAASYMMKYSRAISRVKWLSGEKNQRFEDHLCPRPQGTSPLNHLTRLKARENFIIHSRRESNKSLSIIYSVNITPPF
jgi:hypothetical protein